MNKPARLGLAAFAVTCLGVLDGAAALDLPQPLSGPQLRALLLGNTLIDVEGTSSIYYPTAETMWGVRPSGDVDVGRWWVENDSYCRAWRRWFDAEIRCWQLALGENDSIFWYSLDGTPAGRSLMRSGYAIGEPKIEGTQSAQIAEAATDGSSAASDAEASSATRPESRVAFGRKDGVRRSDKKPQNSVPQAPGEQRVGQSGPLLGAETAAQARAVLAFEEMDITVFSLGPPPEDPFSHETTAPAEPAPAPAPTPVSAEPASLDDAVAEVVGREKFGLGSEIESAKNRGEAAAGTGDGGSDRD